MAFGLPTTTLSLANSDHLLDSTSGSVSGQLAATRLLNVADPAPAVVMTGKATSHTSNGLHRSIDIKLKIVLKRLYHIQASNRYTAPNCDALLTLIPGTHNGFAGYSDYHLQWEQIKFSEIGHRHGSETRIESVRLFLQNGGAGELMPDWTNERIPQRVALWKEYIAELLRYELGRVRILADFLKSHHRPYVVNATGSAATGAAADELLLREDAKLRALENELSAAQGRYHDKIAKYIKARCP